MKGSGFVTASTSQLHNSGIHMTQRSCPHSLKLQFCHKNPFAWFTLGEIYIYILFFAIKVTR